ncbi:hypothetical protein EV360DRAFT_67004, partial [Lentinula raphanica]
MTRPLHILPLGIICVFLASAISPEVLAAPTSFNSPGGDSRSGSIRSTATGLLEPVVQARDGLKVDDHVSSCLSSAGADNSCRVSLDGNTAPQSLRILRRRAQSLDDPFSNTHAAGEHAPGQGGNLHSQAAEYPDHSEPQGDVVESNIHSLLLSRAVQHAHVARGEPGESSNSGHHPVPPEQTDGPSKSQNAKQEFKYSPDDAKKIQNYSVKVNVLHFIGHMVLEGSPGKKTMKEAAHGPTLCEYLKARLSNEFWPMVLYALDIYRSADAPADVKATAHSVALDIIRNMALCELNLGDISEEKFKKLQEMPCRGLVVPRWYFIRVTVRLVKTRSVRANIIARASAGGWRSGFRDPGNILGMSRVNRQQISVLNISQTLSEHGITAASRSQRGRDPFVNGFGARFSSVKVGYQKHSTCNAADTLVWDTSPCKVDGAVILT